jgi:hypothetical protein
MANTITNRLPRLITTSTATTTRQKGEHAMLEGSHRLRGGSREATVYAPAQAPQARSTAASARRCEARHLYHPDVSLVLRAMSDPTRPPRVDDDGVRTFNHARTARAPAWC